MEQFMAVYCVCVARVGATEMEDVAFIEVKQHLPLAGPLIQIVQTFLELYRIIIVIHFVQSFCVIGELGESAVNNVYSCVNVVNEYDEQQRAQNTALWNTRWYG